MPYFREESASAFGDEKEVKSLATVLLGFLIAASLISAFSPVPFLSFAIGLLAFPLALKLSWSDLFVVSLVHAGFNLAIQLNYMVMQLQMGEVALASMGLSGFAFLLWLLFLPFYAIIAVALSIGYASTMKVLARFTPKRIRLVVMGNL